MSRGKQTEQPVTGVASCCPSNRLEWLGSQAVFCDELVFRYSQILLERPRHVAYVVILLGHKIQKPFCISSLIRRMIKYFKIKKEA